MPVDFRPEAIDEIENARDWLGARSAAALQRFDKALNDVVRWIGQTPTTFAEVAPGIRQGPLLKTSYSVVYRELPGRVEVLAVPHGRQRPGYWADRV